jgi:purine catabolism regulator
MKRANELSLGDFFNAYHEDAESFLKQQKMMITSTEAWGVLRKDLIETLGVERAKRFLLRYGRHCGKVEAKMLKNMFDWQDDKEWLIAGTKMHKITGRTFSNLTKFAADIDKGQFDVKGLWVDSYEAKQHVQYFSFYHDPICFFLVGWAGGYCSECLGQPVYFKEVQCVGKGDDACEYVGKSLQQWGEEIKDELIDYENDLADELDRVFRRVEKQKEALKLGSTISQRLTKALLQGKRLHDFVKIIYEEMRCPVLIENQTFSRLASLGNLTIQEDNLSVDQIFQAALLKKEREKLLVKLNEQTAIETEQRLKGELLEELFNEHGESAIVSAKLASLGYNLDEPHYVFSMHIQTNTGESNDENYLELRDTITDRLRKEMEKHQYRALISTKLNQVHTIINKNILKKKNVDIKQFAQQFIELSDRFYPKNIVCIGVSHVCLDHSKYYKMFQEASKAIEIAKMKSDASTVVLATDLGHLTLLLDARNPRELESFAYEKLRNLYDYDNQSHSEFLKTLYYYMDCECNLYKTAREMNVSISGMRYRIKRIQELLDADLSTSSVRFEIQLALEIFLVYGKLQL